MSNKTRANEITDIPETASAPQPRGIALPKPAFRREKHLSKALIQRKTVREFSGRTLSPQLLSALLWAAWGVNRNKGPFGLPGRTAASASSSQEIDLYVALKEGTYLYDAPRHKLLPTASGDLRALALNRGQGKLGIEAPVHLIFVADINKLTHTAGFQEPGLQDPEVQKSYYYVDTGLIAGNVYLFAASQGLAAWFHNCQRKALADALRLRPEQQVLFAQTIGYPKK